MYVREVAMKIFVLTPPPVSLSKFVLRLCMFSKQSLNYSINSILEHLLRSELFQLYYVTLVPEAPLCGPFTPSLQVTNIDSGLTDFRLTQTPKNTFPETCGMKMRLRISLFDESLFNQHISSFYALKHSGNHINQWLHVQNCTFCPHSARVPCDSQNKQRLFL